MGKFIVTRNEKTIYREKGFADAYAGRPKAAEFPSPEAQGSYVVGYRLGKVERERAV